MADICAKLGCEVSSTGRCSEGHSPPASCQFFGKSPNFSADPEFIESAEDDAPAPPTSVVQLPRGEPLSPAEVDEFLRWRPAKMVAILGERDSGKTTLICALYDR